MSVLSLGYLSPRAFTIALKPLRILSLPDACVFPRPPLSPIYLPVFFFSLFRSDLDAHATLTFDSLSCFPVFPLLTTTAHISYPRHPSGE